MTKQLRFTLLILVMSLLIPGCSSTDQGYLTPINSILRNSPPLDIKEQWFQAIRYGDIPIVQQFLTDGWDIETKLYALGSCDTGLMIACYYGLYDMVCFLLENGADVLFKSPSGFTAMKIAGSQSDSRIISILLLFEAEPTDCLLNVCKYGYRDHLVIALAESTLDDVNSTEALICSAYLGRYDFLNLLLANGAPYNENAYRVAIEQGHTTCAELLLEYK